MMCLCVHTEIEEGANYSQLPLTMHFQLQTNLMVLNKHTHTRTGKQRERPVMQARFPQSLLLMWCC